MSEQVAPPTPPLAQPEPPKKSAGKKVLSILAVILVAVIVGVVKFGLRELTGDDDKTAEAKVGDCIAELPEVKSGEEEEANNAKVVECTSTDAAYAVVGRVDNQTEAQASVSTECEQYVKEGQEYWKFTSIKTGGTGYMLCLVKKA